MNYKKNHYVPRFYLRSFAISPDDRDQMVWVYDKEPNKEPRKQSLKKIAFINDLYIVSVPGLASTALETAFSKQESAVSPILAKWKKQGARPEIDDIPEVAYFLALLYLRNPKTAKFCEAMSELISAEKAKALASNDVMFNDFWASFVARRGIAPGSFTKDEFRERVLNFDDHFQVKIDPKYKTISPLAYADDLFNELKKMHWCLCFAPKEWRFITSDSPIVVRFENGTKVAYGGGFGHPTAQVTFPISPKVCLYLTRTCRWKAMEVDSSFVKTLNSRMAINADRYVFAAQLSAGIEKLVRKYSYTQKLPRLDKAEVIDNIKRRRTRHSAGGSEPPTDSHRFSSKTN